jgi:BlaI family transcriptional regulator, penicillinase repressor
MAPAPFERLTRREREIVETLLALSNRASAEEIRQHLTDPPSYSAVRALLARLEAKGCVRHTEEGARYIYSATMPVRRAARSVLRQHVRVFWDGSRSRLIAALLRDEEWSAEELEELKQTIEQTQAGEQGRRSS